MTTAFVLGGGGLLGAHEVGMLRALSEAGVRPDLVVGTSIGAINGAFVAADPAGAAGRLARMWQGDELRLAFSEKLWGRAAHLVRSGTHLHSLEPLRRLLASALPGSDFADLELPFQCVAASIETASARWFSSGPVVPAVMASCAVPGLLPPVEVDGAHYFDGGLVDSIPVGRAVALGAGTVYVLQVGRIESPLEVPTRMWEVGLVAFEIARRHRFHEEMSSLPSHVRVHVLPTGGDRLPPGLAQFRYRDRARVSQSIERAYAASARYLAALTRQLPGLLAKGRSRHAPTQAGPQGRGGPDADRPRRGRHRAVPLAGAARAAVRAGRAVAGGSDAQPAAGVVRGGMAHRGDRGAGHDVRPVDHQRVRRPPAYRAVPGAALRGHPAVPRLAVPGGGEDVRAAGFDR
jgi:NTE family protein